MQIVFDILNSQNINTKTLLFLCTVPKAITSSKIINQEIKTDIYKSPTAFNHKE